MQAVREAAGLAESCSRQSSCVRRTEFDGEFITIAIIPRIYKLSKYDDAGLH